MQVLCGCVPEHQFQAEQGATAPLQQAAAHSSCVVAVLTRVRPIRLGPFA